MSVIDLTFDERLTNELSSQEYTSEQQSCINAMKMVHHLTDETLNTIKLIIYDWNINSAVKYYKTDNFCIDYFLNECKENECPLKLQHKYHFYNIWNNRNLTQNEFKLVKTLLEYILYTNKRPNSSNLYCCYGYVLRESIKTRSRKQELMSERYFVKAISLNEENYDAHCGYGILLSNQSFCVYDFTKALKHHQLACLNSKEDDPHTTLFYLNYAKTLLQGEKKYNYHYNQYSEQYKKSLFYAGKAIKLNPDNWILAELYLIAAKALYFVEDYQQSVECHEKAIQLSNNFDRNRAPSTYIGGKLFLLANESDESSTSTSTTTSTTTKPSKTETSKRKDWDQLYNKYLDSSGHLMELKENVKYLSYFNDMMIHNNTNDIDYLVNGYVRKNTKDMYDLSPLVTIIKKYFGPTETEYTIAVKHKLRSMIMNETDTNMNVELGHLYRTVIFNISLFNMETLKSQCIKFEIVKSNPCNYWANNCRRSRHKLGFGFAIGAIKVDTNQKIAFDYNCDINGNSNPLLLSQNMNLFVTDLPTLYGNAVKFLGASHFVFDQNQDCFVWKQGYKFRNRGRNRNRLSNSVYGTEISDKQRVSIKTDQVFEMSISWRTIISQCTGYENTRSVVPYIKIVDNDRKYKFGGFESAIKNFTNNFRLLPVVSCPGCNCSSCSDSPLILRLIH